MGIDRDMLDQLRRLLRPFATRISNVVARGVVQLVKDAKKQQLLQLGVLAGETIDDAEHFHPYGFSSVPLTDAEVVVLFPNGDRGHPLVVAVSDRRYRPTGGQPGEVTFYNDKGAHIVMKTSGDIEVTPGPGGKVLVADAGGTPVELALKSDVEKVDAKYANHIHQLDSVTINDPTSGPYDHLTPNSAAPPNYLSHAGVPLADAGVVGTSVFLAK